MCVCVWGELVESSQYRCYFLYQSFPAPCLKYTKYSKMEIMLITKVFPVNRLPSFWQFRLSLLP